MLMASMHGHENPAHDFSLRPILQNGLEHTTPQKQLYPQAVCISPSDFKPEAHACWAKGQVTTNSDLKRSAVTRVRRITHLRII